MNYGHFFSLDYESSSLQDGIVFYYYRGIEDKDKKGNNDHSSRFPIYLTISKESIDFRIHYYNDVHQEFEASHVHNIILSLPISTNLEIKDRLTDTIAEAYYTDFPSKSKGNLNRHYLFNLVNSFTKDSNSNTYSDSNVFNIYNEKGKFQSKIVEDYEVKESFIRKLILDFIFDLEHSKIFQTSQYYEYIFIKLKENFFFNALSNKANFYYHKALARERLNKVIDDESLTFYKEQLLKVETEWAKYIRHPNSDEVFHSSGGWFNHPEKEMDDIYIIQDKKERKVKSINEDSILSSKWYIRRYAFQNVIIGECNKTIWPILSTSVTIFSLSILLTFFSSNKDYSCIQLFSSCIQFFSLALLLLFIVFLVIKHFTGKSYFFGVHIFIPRLFIAIVAGWVSIFLDTDMLGFNSSDNKNVNKVILSSKSNSFNFQLENSQNTNPTTYEKFINSKPKMFTLLFILFTSVVFFVYYQIGKYNPYWTPTYQRRGRLYINRIKRTLFFCAVGFIYSYMIGRGLYILFNSEGKICADFWIFFQPLTSEFLLYTCITMFIGIFIQLTFDEKPMTEEL